MLLAIGQVFKHKTLFGDRKVPGRELLARSSRARVDLRPPVLGDGMLPWQALWMSECCLENAAGESIRIIPDINYKGSCTWSKSDELILCPPFRCWSIRSCLGDSPQCILFVHRPALAQWHARTLIIKLSKGHCQWTTERPVNE